jgi:hypothetical protein
MRSDSLPFISHANDQTDDLTVFWAAQNNVIDALLLTHGTILFKGFKINTEGKFGSFMRALPLALGCYIDGNSPRIKLSDAVYTSTEYPAEFSISLHNELSYSNIWPARLYFCCLIAGSNGGSTTIADSRILLDSLPSDLVREYEEKGVMYVRNLRGEGAAGIGKSWQQTFETTSRMEWSVIVGYETSNMNGFRTAGYASCRRDLLLRNIRCMARRCGLIKQINSTLPPIRLTSMKHCSNSMRGRPSICRNTAVSTMALRLRKTLAEVRRVMGEQEVAFGWERGDLMVIDNKLSAHGHSAYTGERKVLVSMTNF